MATVSRHVRNLRATLRRERNERERRPITARITGHDDSPLRMTDDKFISGAHGRLAEETPMLDREEEE